MKKSQSINVSHFKTGKFSSLLIFTLLVISPLLSIAAGIPDYQWEKVRKRYELSTAEQAMPELIIKDHTQFDYVFENNQFLMYATEHRIILVNNNEAIQKHNKIYIPMRNTLELSDFKARTINKNGEVVLFDKNNMKELKNEESGSSMRIFAIEGIELGSEIEYYYTRKMNSNLFEKTLMQTDVQVKSASFLLSCPDHLRFDFKTYHGFPDVKKDTLNGRNIYTTSMADVPPLKSEPFSFYESNLKRIEYKLAYNSARSNARLYTWDDAAKTFYNVLSKLSKDDEKAIEKYVKTLDDKPTSGTVNRIKNIENKIKSSIQLNNVSREEALDKVESVIKTKIASREGVTKLFIGVFEKLGITCNPVITCSREKSKFDPSFDSWDFLDDYLLFFPETKGFIAPYVQETRYPLVPADFTSNQGLFIEPFQLGDVKSALGSIHDIPAVDYTLNADNLDMDVSFGEDMAFNQIRMKREFSGYNAAFISPYFHLMSEAQVKEMIEQFTKQTAPDHTIKTFQAKPVTDNLSDKFFIDVDFQSSHFLEKAGSRVLFKIGELIGPQMEMYRDDQRATDVENEYNRGYDRIIKLTMPDGYVVKNADDLKFDVAYKDQDAIPFLFQSDFSIDKNVLKVTIREYYKQIYAPLARYEDYRKVINAAADFNKVTLIFEKNK
jgi:hypothetical protein